MVINTYILILIHKYCKGSRLLWTMAQNKQCEYTAPQQPKLSSASLTSLLPSLTKHFLLSFLLLRTLTIPPPPLFFLQTTQLVTVISSQLKSCTVHMFIRLTASRHCDYFKISEHYSKRKYVYRGKQNKHTHSKTKRAITTTTTNKKTITKTTHTLQACVCL